MSNYIFHKIIDRKVCKILNKDEAKNIKSLILIREYILQIFVKTGDASTGLIRLKWFYDNINHKNITLLDITSDEKDYLITFLDNINEDDMSLLLEYINSFTPLVGRYQLYSLYDEFILPLSNSYAKIFYKLTNNLLSQKTLVKYHSCFFISMKFTFIKGGWNFSKDNNIYINQLKEIYQKCNDTKLSHKSRVDRYINNICLKIFKDNFHNNINKINESPNINIGSIILKSLFYSSFN